MGIFDRLRRLLGGGDAVPPPRPPAAPTPPFLAPLPAAEPPAVAPMVDRAQAAIEGAARRNAVWASVGTLEPDVLTHRISPSLLGGPAWPSTRQAYRVIRRQGGLILATDGLSDPFDAAEAPDESGFGLELFLETADIAAEFQGAPGEVAALGRSWAFELLSHVAGSVAGAGGIGPQLERFGVLSMELPGFSRAHSLPGQLPPGFATTDDALGILLGGPAPDFPDRIADMPLSPVRLVPVVLLKASELEVLRSGDAATRQAMAERLAALPSGHRSSLGRPAVS